MGKRSNKNAYSTIELSERKRVCKHPSLGAQMGIKMKSGNFKYFLRMYKICAKLVLWGSEDAFPKRANNRVEMT